VTIDNLKVTGDTELDGKLLDTNNDAGTSGQLLSSTETGIDWVDPGADGVQAFQTRDEIAITTIVSASVNDFMSVTFTLNNGGTVFIYGKFPVDMTSPERIVFNLETGGSNVDGTTAFLSHGINFYSIAEVQTASLAWSGNLAAGTYTYNVDVDGVTGTPVVCGNPNRCQLIALTFE